MMPRYASSVTSRMHSHAASYGGVVHSYENRNIFVMDVTANHSDSEMAKPSYSGCIMTPQSV